MDIYYCYTFLMPRRLQRSIYIIGRKKYTIHTVHMKHKRSLIYRLLSIAPIPRRRCSGLFYTPQTPEYIPAP